jgi:hypothetical protein
MPNQANAMANPPIDIPLHPDLYVPFSAIQIIENDRVVLDVPNDRIYDMS